MPKGEYLQYGGMAVLGGVMMRSPNHYAVACRVGEGEIVIHAAPIRKNFARTVLAKVPILRGVVALVDSMALGITAMNYAAEKRLELGDPDEIDRPKRSPSDDPPGVVSRALSTAFRPIAWLGRGIKAGVSAVALQIKPAQWWQDVTEKTAIGVAIVIGLALSFSIFQGSPVFIAQMFAPLGVTNYIFLNIIEGCLKACVFLGYLLAISRMAAVKDLFQYHGAEHKAINCLENDQPLTIENVRKQTRLHPRCGTSFLVIVMILSMITFTFVPRDFNTGHLVLNLLVRIAIKIPVLPLLAGIAYEGIRIAGRMKNQRMLFLLFWPGLMTQYITTQEPEEKHIKVALASLEEVVTAEARESEVPEEAVVATL